LFISRPSISDLKQQNFEALNVSLLVEQDGAHSQIGSMKETVSPSVVSVGRCGKIIGYSSEISSARMNGTMRATPEILKFVSFILTIACRACCPRTCHNRPCLFVVHVGNELILISTIEAADDVLSRTDRLKSFNPFALAFAVILCGKS
jgi:hypothetical protein